jgi:hypothetical protein
MNIKPSQESGVVKKVGNSFMWLLVRIAALLIYKNATRIQMNADETEKLRDALSLMKSAFNADEEQVDDDDDAILRVLIGLSLSVGTYLSSPSSIIKISASETIEICSE